MCARIINADCLTWTSRIQGDAVDLVFGSPPYEDARTYGIGFKRCGQDWVDWAVERFIDQVRICNGLVCWVIEGKTKDFRWSATPALFMADLHRAGVHLRKPPAYCRHGIPGSGGPDYLRNDYEFIAVGSKGGKLAWSDTDAMGWPCKYETGGAFSYRTPDGQRINEQKHNQGSKASNGRPRGRPEITNPGNVIRLKVGKGHMGSDLAHENEAPFSESLAEFFIRSFCPPGGKVFDPFCGSGTTLKVAEKFGRLAIGTDVRPCQVELSTRRMLEVTA